MPAIQVALPVPLRQLFSYSHDQTLLEGTRVSVPFGSRKLVGIVIEAASATSNDSTIELKPILEVLDDTPMLPNSILVLAKWLAEYYHLGLGETLFTVIPGWLRSTRSSDTLHALIAESYFQITDAGLLALPSLPKSAKAQARALSLLEQGLVSHAEINKQISKATIKVLLEKEWITRSEKIVQGCDNWLPKLSLGNKPLANKAQASAIGVMVSQLNQFIVSLLEGVTGSGKTEVYLQIIESVLLQGKQVLILVPEIGLTPQMVSRFEQRFGYSIGVLHSQVTDRQRARIWLQAKHGQLPLILGTRSAVFTPFEQLGLIIVDEEHDDSFKQQDGLRYHARDVAIMRAKKLSIPIMLGSATPSLESLNNALFGKYQHLQLTARAGKAQAVSQYIQDMRNHPLRAGLSEHLLDKMQQHLSAGNQVLVFLNRRGFSPALLCHHCGYVETCEQCDRPMTWHKQHRRMRCHQCDLQRAAPYKCASCGSTEWVTQGMGTEQLESLLKQSFPDTAIARIDRDVTRKKNALDETFAGIRKGHYQLLVGTQIIAKGHHFPDVTLVVIVDVDAALFSADIRATEKLAQLVTQLAGRAGREQKPGEMWLQTHQPQHPMLQDLINNGYHSVSRNMLAERKHAKAIPFCLQALIRVESQSQQLAFEVLQNARISAFEDKQLTILGPMPGLIEKKQGRHRMLLIMQSINRKILHQQIHRLIKHLHSDKQAKKVRWSVDVDAIDLT